MNKINFSLSFGTGPLCGSSSLNAPQKSRPLESNTESNTTTDTPRSEDVNKIPLASEEIANYLKEIFADPKYSDIKFERFGHSFHFLKISIHNQRSITANEVSIKLSII